MPDMLPLSQNDLPSPRDHVDTLLAEIVEWMETHRPGQSLGASAWRSSFGPMASRWAQLADWTLELSTQLAVETMLAREKIQTENSPEITSFTRQLEQFERDFHGSSSLGRMLDRSGNRRLGHLRERSMQLEKAWGQVRAAKEKQLADLASSSQLAGLLVDASDFLVDQAPAIVEIIRQQQSVLPGEQGGVLEQRTSKRRQEMAESAANALRHVLPRLEKESIQHKIASRQLADLRETDQDLLTELKSRLFIAIGKANQVLDAPGKSIAVEARKGGVAPVPRASAWSIASLARHGSMPHVSGGVSRALVRLLQREAYEGYMEDVRKVAGARGLHRTSVPYEGSSSVSCNALGLLISELGSERGSLWNSKMRKGLAENIARWAAGLPYSIPVGDEGYDLPSEARGVASGNMFQAIYELSVDQPAAAMKLFAKVTKLPPQGKVYLPNGEQLGGLTWMRRWLLSLDPDKVLHAQWSLAMSRLCLEQMDDGYHRLPVFSDRDEIANFCRLNKTPDMTMCAVVFRDLLREQETVGGRLIAALVNWDEVEFHAPTSDQMSLLDKACQAAASRSVWAARSLAEWLAKPGRFGKDFDWSSHRGLSRIFVEAGRYLKDEQEAVPVSLLSSMFNDAPLLMASFMRKKQITLENGKRCETYADAATWFKQLPKSKSRAQVKAIFRDHPSFLFDIPFHAFKELLVLAMEREDVGLACVLRECSRAPTMDTGGLDSFMKKLWKEGSASPAQRAQWLKSSRHRHALGLYPSSRGEILEFLTACLSDDLSNPDTMFDMSYLPSWLGAPGLLVDQPLQEPGELFRLVSKALDASVAAYGDLPSPQKLAEQSSIMDQMEMMVAKTLDQMDCSSWSQEPAALAHAWRDVYEKRWIRRMREDMGNAVADPPPTIGDFVVHQPSQVLAPHGSVHPFCWFYDLHAIDSSDLPKAIDRVKIMQLADPRVHAVPGMHLRASLERNGVGQIIGIDREMEIDSSQSTKSILQAWREASMRMAEQCGESIQDISIEGLPYDRIHVSTINIFSGLGEDEKNRLLQFGTPSGPMAMYGTLSFQSVGDWSCQRHMPLIEVKSRDLVPVDMCIPLASRKEMQRHPSFAASAGGDFPPRDHDVLDVELQLKSMPTENPSLASSAKPAHKRLALYR